MTSFTRSCVCGKDYGDNCAHYLSNWMIENKTLSKNPSGCYCCEKGRPLRAKEMRDVFIAMGKTKTFNAPKGNCFIYCESDGHQGHVYYGTKTDAVAGWLYGAATYYEYYVYRHGDRTPAFSYPTSTADESSWPNGFGQLTQRGRIQQIRLGKYIRERYSQLLNSTYVASEINIRSSDYDRTLMSAYSNLLGLYPTSTDQLDLILSELEKDENKWPVDIPWQPIPVHTVPQPIDYLMGVSQCPYFFELVEKISNGEQIQNISREFRNFFDELQIWTGSKINNLFDAWILADAIIIEASYNKSASWANSSVLIQLQQIADLSFFYLFNSTETKKIIGGPMINDIMENIGNFIANKSNGLKAKIYSGHDASIFAVLAFFEANYNHQPPYCSTLFFDLYHSQENNTYYLKLEYLNSTNGQTTYPIKLPPCEDVMCSIEVLNQWLENRLPNKDMNKECISRTSFARSILNNKYQLYIYLCIIVFFFHYF